MSPEEPPGESPIEMEPLSLPPSVARHVSSAIPESQRTALHAAPVPGQPLHLCPCCDYNLTGLTSRRCPECGQEFDLREARIRGMWVTDRVRFFFYSSDYDRLRIGIGIALVALVLVGMNFDPSVGLSGWMGLRTTDRGGATLSVLVLLIGLAFVFRWGRGMSWADAVWWVGLATAGAGILLMGLIL